MKIGFKRLLKLADILDKADAAHRKAGEPRYVQTLFRHQCGTPGCALGHWAAHRLPKKRRLHMSEYWDLGARDFGLSQHDLLSLFGPFGCNNASTAKQAAKFLRKFVQKSVSSAGESK